MNEKTKQPSEKAMGSEEFYKRLSRDDKQAVVDLSVQKPIKFIPSGSWVINSIIGDGTNTNKSGGYPRGHVVEIFGDESAGKTTLALGACKQVQEMGGHAVFLDFERTFHAKYAQNLGLSLDKNKFTLIRPDHFQHGARLIRDALLMKPWLIAVDSVSAMTPKETLEGSIDEAGRIGLQAQLMSMFLSIITKKIEESETCLMFLNQMRMVINMGNTWSGGGPKEESSGGNALRYYSSLRLKLNTVMTERIASVSTITGKEEKKAVNVIVKVTAIKNKIDSPAKSGPIFIRFGEGVDNIASIMELAINTEVIKKSGAFYTFREGDKILINSHGKEDLRRQLKDNEGLFKKVCDNLVVKEDVEEKAQASIEENYADAMDDALEGVSKNYIEKQKKKKTAQVEKEKE
jgi:recombination protein RecA